MFARQRYYRSAFYWMMASVLAAACCAVAPPAVAAGLDKIDASLKLVPADAAFYSASLRNREQFEAILNSKAWAKIREMPIVQQGLAIYEAQKAVPDTGPGKLEAALKNPETRKIVDLLVDMVSDEVFVYGDDSVVDFVDLLQKINIAQSYGPLALQMSGLAEGRDPNQLQAMMVFSALADNVDEIAVPDFIIGFKLKNPDLAKEQLIKLEAIGNVVLGMNETTQGRFKKTKVGQNDYLVLELDGSLIPWDEVPMEALQAIEATEGDAQKLVDRIKESKLVVAIGVRDNYLLVSVGSSLECLEKLGTGERLIDRPELKPLEKYADKRLVSIGYLSEDLNEKINNQVENLEEIVEIVTDSLPEAGLTDEQSEKIRKDAAVWFEDVKSLTPEVGAIVGLSFLVDRGIEGYQYTGGKHADIDGSKPLGLLQHVGGSPILGVVQRAKVDLKKYDMMVRWLKMGYGYFEELALPKIPEEDRRKLESFLKAALPLVERLDKANREKLIPALADGQSAIVIDAKLQSKQFFAAMPEMEEPMPMIEPALVMGVSDAKLLKEGLAEYREILNGLIDAMRQVEGTDVPEEINIPEPEATKTSSGTIYTFALPEEWGVDSQIVPSFGLSDTVATVTISKAHAERLLQAAPLSVGGLLEKTDRPLANASWFQWAALLDVAGPWIDFAAEQIMDANGVADDERPAIVDQVHTGLEVLKTLRGVTSEVYLEGDVLVNHTLLEIRDVE